jgi:hypothetical protein
LSSLVVMVVIPSVGEGGEKELLFESKRGEPGIACLLACLRVRPLS